MKVKRILITVAICICVMIMGIIGYFWFVKPSKIYTDHVSDSNSEDIFMIVPKENRSDNPKDYREVHISNHFRNRSIFKVNSIVGQFVSYGEEYKDRVVYTYKTEQFGAGDEVPDNFCDKYIAGGSVWFYVGDLKNEDEILDIIYDFVNTCEIEYTYNMQWLGTKTIRYKVKIDRDKVTFFDEYEDEEPTILKPEE